MENLVEIDHVSKTFADITALKTLTVTIPKGQMLGLVGPDGAGKTTLIRLIAALMLPSTGTIRVAGYDTRLEATQIHQLIGYMPQKFGLYEDLTVMQNLNLYADLKGILGDERETTFTRLLSFTGLGPFTKRLAGALSGGMKQKLGLACTLIRKPALLLLDEPSVGVDPISRRELWKMVHDLMEEGISILWSTAYLDEAERFDAVLLLNEGYLLYDGPPAHLTQRVKDRTFKLTNIEGQRREVLIDVIQQPNVIDGVLQGQDVRIVTRHANEHIHLKDKDIQQNPTAPRFEDAFIDILGGGPTGVSELAKLVPSLPKNVPHVIEARDLVKKFGSFVAANRVTFSVKSGEIFGLIGPNGAGKSTTFKMLCGLLSPTSGEAYVNGLDLQDAPGAARSKIGYMAQKFSLYGNLSVKQNLNFFSGIYNLKGKRQEDAIEEMIELFGFQPFLDLSADTLSLGFKQRLALSCAVMHHPPILFLDEPTSGVDPITRREFWNHINGLVEKGITVMVTTHFMDEAEYCDRIALIYQSRIIKIGSPDSLKAEVRSEQLPFPTLEDAFIQLIEDYNRTKVEEV